MRIFFGKGLVCPVNEKKDGYDNLLSAKTNDVLLFDTPVTKDNNGINFIKKKKPYIVFLNYSKNTSIRLEFLNNGFSTIDMRSSLIKFKELIFAASVNPDLNINKISNLSQREKYVFHEALLQKSPEKISLSSGMKLSTVYSHRRNACMKLGIKKPEQILPFVNSYAMLINPA